MSDTDVDKKEMNTLQKVKQQYFSTCEKVDALSKRERLIIFAVLLVTVYGLVQMTLLDPQLKHSKYLERQLSDVQKKTRSVEQEQIIVSAQISAGPNKALQSELKNTNQLLEKADARLRESTVSLIPPALMPQVMQEVLGDIKNLRLINLENRGAFLLTKVKAKLNQESTDSSKKENSGEEDEVAGSKLYRHSFVITLEGSYRATLTFIQALEKKPWKFFWQNMRYEVIKYPKAKVILEVYTLSTEEDWIGV